jgi:hypothetical protein
MKRNIMAKPHELPLWALQALNEPWMRTPEVRAGHCYMVAGTFAAFAAVHGDSRLKIVHGSALGEDGKRQPHAWCEIGNQVLTTVAVGLAPWSEFRRLNKAKRHRVYTPTEAVAMQDEHVFYGPWHRNPYGTDWYDIHG